jgi:hypothetical protein
MLAEEYRPNEVAPSGTTNARMLVRVRNAYWEAVAMELDALSRTTASPSALHPINVKGDGGRHRRWKRRRSPCHVNGHRDRGGEQSQHGDAGEDIIWSERPDLTGARLDGP